MSDFSFYLVTDPHYFDESFGRSGSAYEARSRTDQKCVAETPAILDAGLELIFTGHMHAQAVTEHISPAGNTITDVQTGCFVGCPCAYRKVTVAPDGQVDIRSYTIDDFDYDKGGRTAAEYLQWRFDRMITDIIDAMATDFDAFMGKFVGSQGKEKLKGPVTAVGKLLQKLTVKKLGRLFWFRVDPSIGDRRVVDVGVELVRNIFVGNEPYVPGTPMYDALDHLLRRLSPVLHILEKKLAVGNPQLSDLRAFVLSMIGDEQQRDYDCTLQLTK